MCNPFAFTKKTRFGVFFYYSKFLSIFFFYRNQSAKKSILQNLKSIFQAMQQIIHAIKNFDIPALKFLLVVTAKGFKPPTLRAEIWCAIQLRHEAFNSVCKYNTFLFSLGNEKLLFCVYFNFFSFFL